VAANNSGSSTLTADGCAGCHRAHTAQGPLLLAASDQEALCLSCHGATGTGATTDVESGVQYAPLANGVRDTTAVLGALRGGGFVTARIDAANPIRVAYLSGTPPNTSVRQSAKVPVLTSGQAVTSAHIALVGAAGVTATHKAWGNGALGTAGSGPTVDLECATCHNPHGNGMYRILNPVPNPTATSGTFTAAATGVSVTDAADPTNATRNYTVIQVKGPSYLLLASDVVTAGYGNATGDYLHRKLPWNGTSGTANDAPNGDPTNFNAQMNAWCASCHTRYSTSALTGWGGTPPVNTTINGSIIDYTADADPGSGSFDTPSGDATFKYRHSTTSNKPCTTCHVSHGSNAVMDGAYSSTFPYPDGSTAPSSRLLKAGNRGTCQLCHDPTGTITAGTVLPPGATQTVP
jgi:predicted CXXCH cytochrome family protein